MTYEQFVLDFYRKSVNSIIDKHTIMKLWCSRGHRFQHHGLNLCETILGKKVVNEWLIKHGNSPY